MYITPNETGGNSDNESISLAVKKAKENGINKVVIPKHDDRTDSDLWLFEDTVRLPSDIEIVIDNAHLRMEDNTFCNMFISDNAGTEEGGTLKGELKNITVRGIGNATLDGGNYNGLGEFNSLKDGNPHVSVNTMMLFFNVDGLRVENLRIINNRWWAVTNIFVRNAVYKNIDFKSIRARIDKEGNIYYDEEPENFFEDYVKNADGIDLRIGCNNFLIENITGCTGDDSVALTALGKFEKNLGYVVEGKDYDIHDVKIHHVATDPHYCSCVRLLNDNGYKLYNVEIDGVTHMQKERDNTFGKTQHTVRIGDMAYAETHSHLGDTRNITIKNVISRGVCAVTVCKGLADSHIENIIVLDSGSYGFGTDPECKLSKIKNCTIRNIMAIGKESQAINYENLEITDCDIQEG